MLRSKLAQSLDENHYNVDYLLNFLDQKVKERTSLTTVEGKTPQLSVSESGLTLKNLFLTYTNERDYETRVQTDIQILFPQMNFTESGSFPNVLKICTDRTERSVFRKNIKRYRGWKYLWWWR